jgi:hypothetical protein
VASCLLSTAIRGGGTVPQQVRSVNHLFSILSSHWSCSLSRGWLPASSLPPSEAGERYHSRSGQYITCLAYSLLIGLAVRHVGGLVPSLHCHQRRGNRTSASGKYNSSLPYSLFIGLAICHLGGLVPTLHRHQRRGIRTTADQVTLQTRLDLYNSELALASSPVLF